MRNLTIKQRNLLRRWFEETHAECVNDLTESQWETLQSINDTEILYQNVNHFLNELCSQEVV